MYHIFFIHSSVHGHLGCFHVLATVTSAAHILRCIWTSSPSVQLALTECLVTQPRHTVHTQPSGIQCPHPYFAFLFDLNYNLYQYIYHNVSCIFVLYHFFSIQIEAFGKMIILVSSLGS